MKSFAIAVAALLILAVPAFTLAVDVRVDSVATVLPDHNVIDRAAALVRARVGENFFSRYVQFRALYLKDERSVRVIRMRTFGGARSTSYDVRPEVYYRVDWEVRFPNGNRTAIAFDMDPAGHLLGDPATLRLPPCAEHPEECVFAITGQAARDAALRASGTTGLDASTEFRWSDRHGRYTWTVKMWPPGTNPNAGVAPPEGARFAILDGNTGHVLEAGLWTKPSQVRE